MNGHDISVDIETYSDVDIKRAGLYKYAQSPAFDILLIAYAVDEGPVRLVDLTVDPGANGAGAEYIALQDFFGILNDPACRLHAWNAAFEHTCINAWLEKQGRAPIPLPRWRCTMAHAQYCGYPAALAAAGEAVGLPQDKRKLGIGGALIRKFCVPQKPNRDHPAPWRARPADEPEKWALFKTYCMQDVEAERAIGRRLRKWPLPEREQRLWELTQEANAVGVGVDLMLVNGALEIGERQQAALMAEARALSGLDNPASVRQLMNWLNEELETDEENEITDLKKTTVAELLKTGVSSEKAERMLQLRQLMSKTSTKKYDALAAATCADGRMRGMLAYYGANRTGRWAGRIVQPQNLPQNHLDGLDFARELVKARDAEMLELCWGPIPDTLSQLIRTAFIPVGSVRAQGPAAATRPDLLRGNAAPESGIASRPDGLPPEVGSTCGPKYAVADYSAIEARVVAWLAGEQWVLDAFIAGKDIYCATASQMFGVPVEKHGQNSELRQRGKVATLALGYGGGDAALVNMGALRMGIPEEDLPEIRQKWRQANPAICALWKRVEDAALGAVADRRPREVAVRVFDPGRARENEARTGAAPGSYSDYFRTGAKLVFRREADPASGQDFMTIELPTGRRLFYAHPCLAPSKKFPDRLSLHYYSVNQTSRKWALTDTWGGKLVENITQAVARDCLAETLLELRRRGMIAVMHVHDEVVVEVGPEERLEEILGIMAAPIEWAPGLPLKGAGFVCDYYRKE